MFKRTNKYLLSLFISVAFLILTVSESNTAEDEFSVANQLLFQTDHLASIFMPSVLMYEFQQQGSQIDEFVDTINTRIVNVRETGTKDLEIALFSGERERYIPAFMDNRGNPLISIFLQRDVNQMDGVTEGTWRYFHRQIKLALQDNARIETVKFTFNEKQLDGKKISITPYEDDQHSSELGEYANKYYTFTLSEDIPGYIYQIEAVTPAKQNDAHTSSDIASDILTYKGIECANEAPCVHEVPNQISLPQSKS